MAHAVVLGLLLFISASQAEKMCTRPENLREVEIGKFLPQNQIANQITDGIMTCSVACLSRRRCKSFNFNTKTGECQLNGKTSVESSQQLTSHNDTIYSDITHWPDKLAGKCANNACPLNTYCDPVNENTHVCKVTGCLSSPSVENGHFDEPPEESPIGTVLPLVCDKGFMPRDKVICQDNGTWSSPVCVSVSSCSMVKQYQPDSEDGEYWLRLTNFDNYTTQIYCHNVSTDSANEFLTLRNINYGIYPMVMDEGCNGETGLKYDCAGRGGEVWFNKIRVNIATMEVFKEDLTFANITSQEKHLQYGVAFDCYTYHSGENDLKCGTKGRFTVDLRGTGWRVSADQQWEAYGTGQIIESIEKEQDGTLIFIRCGGFAGGCRPAGDQGLFLKPFPGGV